MLKIKRIMGVLVAAGLAFAIPALADGKEEKVKLADCPEAVQKTIQDNANGGTIVEIEKETNKDGTVTYGAEVKKPNGTEIEIAVAAGGKLIETEVDIQSELAAFKTIVSILGLFGLLALAVCCWFTWRTTEHGQSRPAKAGAVA